MQIRAVVLAAFEPDAGPVPGELRFWMEREGIDQELPFAAGYRPLRLRGDGVLAVITGVGAARAASSTRVSISRRHYGSSRGSLGSIRRVGRWGRWCCRSLSSMAR